MFTNTDFFAVVGNTEIPARSLNGLVMLMSIQRTMEVLSTQDPDIVEWGDTEEASVAYEKEMDKYRIRMLVESDPKAMQALILYGYNYYFTLCMRSRDRKGRAEGVRVGAGAGVKEEAEGVGLTTKMAHALGLGRLTKYQKVYVTKEG
jgi:hypothetical protein